MRKIIRASVMVLALCYPAFAGEILTPPTPQPPPPAPGSTTDEPTPNGEILTPPAATSETTEDLALDLITSLLSLL